MKEMHLRSAGLCSYSGCKHRQCCNSHVFMNWISRTKRKL
jgi:hypothetical protein